MTEHENKQRRREIQKQEPKLCWGFVSIRFGQFLSQNEKVAYTLDEFDTFVQELAMREEETTAGT